MAEKLSRQQVAAKAVVIPEAGLKPRTQIDRGFGLPTVLYALTVGLFLAYLGAMAIGFAHPEMILPMAAFVISILAGFGLPALWVGMRPENSQRPVKWGRFVADGIETASGHLDAKSAAVQVLILPTLIFLWGIATVSIAAIVRG